jgi:hypothetical protein
MKPQHYFWIVATVDGIFDDGKSVSITINRFDGKGMDNVKELVTGKSPWFQNVPFQFYSLVAGERGFGYKEIHTDEALGHNLTDGVQVAVLCTHNETLSGTTTLGLDVCGWTFIDIYNNTRREVAFRNREEYDRRQAEQADMLRQRNCPIRLMLGNKMLRMGTGDEFARFFEYKGWPKGVDIHINQRGTWVVKNDLQMLPRPNGVRNNNRPEWRGKDLEDLYLSVQGREAVAVVQEHEPDERTTFKGKKAIATVSEEGQQKPLAVALAEILDARKSESKEDKKTVPVLPKALKNPNRTKRRVGIKKSAAATA